MHSAFRLLRQTLPSPLHEAGSSMMSSTYFIESRSPKCMDVQALRDAILIPDPDDRRHIEAVAAAMDPPLTWDYLITYRSRWTWSHCKQIIPQPEQLYPAVLQVFQRFGPLKDAETQKPLFNSNAWKSCKLILAQIRLGYLSDVPGVALYYPIGTDHKAGGLTIYRCIRGTNFTEGGVHRNICNSLPTS